ncbi:MAG TPA: hypothetical protein VGL61_11555 [Kofleriaceae bacterium]
MELADVDRAIAAGDPALAELIVRYLKQTDPEPGRSELEPNYDPEDEADHPVEVPAGAFTFERLQQAFAQLAGKTGTERKLARREAFAAAEASAYAPPRLRLGKRLLAMYERGTPADRAALIDVFERAPMKWGAWHAAKAIYKLAEAGHDAALFGVLAYRFDVLRAETTPEIKAPTKVYLRKRAWRYLRQLGRAVPEAYATFAVELLRHYPESYRAQSDSWVAAHVMRHGGLKWARDTASFAPPTKPDELAQRAYPEAWKLSPSPLLRLLESAQNDLVCNFAILCLRADHPLALRAVEPAWLAQLGKRPLPAIHAFVVQLLRDSPELHQSRLRALGLHDVVLGFLRSRSEVARAYALEYAAAHAPDIAVGELVSLVETGEADVAKFASARLEAMAPQQLGVAMLCRLLDRPAAPWAAAKLAQGFSARDLDVKTFVETALRGTSTYNALVKFLNDKQGSVPAAYFTALLDDPRSTTYTLRAVVTAMLADLGKRSARDIGVAWIQRALEDPARTQVVAQWLDAGMLAGADLDIAWLQALVAKPRLRAIALRVLGNRRLVEPSRVGLPWLLELARSSEPELANFAQRMLLESFEPRDFGGVDRVWELATGAKQPEAVRAFAATYLKAHHPELGPQLPEAKALGIKPRLDATAYSRAVVQPLLDDARADVRRLAVAIAGAELVRWNDPDVLYALAGSPHREPRALGSELLLNLIVEGDVRRAPAAWVDGRRLFQLAESPHKPTREVALTLIRRLYDRVGGAERLAWLMDSPERDVRLFAVRLFWDRHRPRALPPQFSPRKPGASIGTQQFGDLGALRQFVRTVMFGLPPGRVGERDPVVAGAPAPERALPASIAKKRLVEALRDVALDDLELARAIALVLAEMSHSIAKGEWQASLQALVQLRAKHGAELAP